MMKKILYSLPVLLLLVFINSPAIAQELPNPELMGSDGKKHQLKDFIGKGKWTTVIVWGPRCPICIDEMPEIQSIHDDREQSNIQVLGLAVDFPSFGYADIKQVQQFEEDYFITFPNLLVSSDIYFELGLGPLRGTPTVFLLDPDGKVKAMQLGKVPRSQIEGFVAMQNSKIRQARAKSQVN